MVEQLRSFAAEVTRVAREVGSEGRLGGQANVPGVAGTWKDLTDSVNSMASNLTGQVRNIAEVSTAIASGDLSKKITVNVSGEILLLKETINTMVDQLNAFAGEVTRVAREVGSESIELIHHRVDGVLEFENFTFHIDRDFSRQVAARHRGGYFGCKRAQLIHHGIDGVLELKDLAADVNRCLLYTSRCV